MTGAEKPYQLLPPFPFVERVPFECQPIDELLGGGVESTSVTLMYGEGGTGKTNFCLQLSRNVARDGRKVFYIDTEGISMERLRQICGEDYGEVLKNMLISEVHSLQEQEKMVEGAERAAANPEVGLIVVDSLTMFYRLGSRGEERSVRESLIRQTESLLSTARRYRIPVLLTSQVFTNIGTGEYESLGGHVLQHNAKTIIRLDKLDAGRRRAVVRKHRSIPEGSSATFLIAGDGLI